MRALAAARAGNEVLDESRLAWIMGSSRSGSTWLLKMLSELPAAVPIDDPHIGHHLGVWRPIPLAWATSSESPELRQLDEIKRSKPGYFFSARYEHAWRPLLRELIAGRFAAQAADAGEPDPLVVVKEPGSQAAETLLSLFPGSRLVFLLRDGRDVVDSWLDAYRDGAWAQEEGAFPLAPDGREAFIRWQASVWAYRTEAVGRAYAAHDRKRRVLVRYEDLLGDPARELGRICDAVGLAIGDHELARIAAMHDFGAIPKERKGKSFEQRRASPGGWRENMSRSERRAMLDELEPVLSRYGYGPRRQRRAA